MSQQPATLPAARPPWTARQVATAFDVSSAWVYKMVDENQIPHVRRGSTILFPYAQLVEWFNRQRSSQQR
jgi:excisionase family DNA binding protein